ncbi:unnamed protein product [Pieris macdunnoughi]|uniref:Malate dehydrogenase, mitochondrial n=1 Tax=Pieris macdunnoughi TaxID=345717 RepID=A0A821SDZ1_9NEOP|nr:unnamed protein product [Pieris macdunnoughi]
MILTKKFFKLFASNVSKSYHVTVVGGANEVGQTISLLLRTQPNIRKLVVYDELPKTSGIALDLSHVPARCTLHSYIGEENLDKALKNADIVIAAGGVSLNPGLTESEWFNKNANFIKMISEKVSKQSPLPFFGIVTEPLNTLVPMASEIMRNHGDYNPKKLFGITTVDALRAQTIYAAENNLNPIDCVVPVICGHSNKTIVPLTSQAQPKCTMEDKKIHEYVNKVRKVESAISNTKPKWSPSLSVAYGALVFTRNILEALDGRQATVNALVENNDFGTSFFAGLVDVTENGFGEMKRYTNITNHECLLLERSIELLRKDVSMGKKILELA